jgi:hypothetical protein
MIEIDLGSTNRLPLQEISDFLSREVSPRRYWLHDKFGGEGWEVTRSRYIKIRLKDEKVAMMLVLKYSR